MVCLTTLVLYTRSLHVFFDSYTSGFTARIIVTTITLRIRLKVLQIVSLSYPTSTRLIDYHSAIVDEFLYGMSSL